MGDVLVTHALAKGADCAEDIGVGIGRDHGLTRTDEAEVERKVGADSGINVVDADAVIAGEDATELLVGRVLLVRAGRVAVEREEGILRVVHSEAVRLERLDHVRATEIAGGPHVDTELDDVARLDRLAAVTGDYLLDDCRHGYWMSWPFSSMTSGSNVAKSAW